MSTFRKHFQVTWNEGEPVDVVTNAWDMAEGAEHSDKPGLASFKAVHHALVRYGFDVPPFSQFMDELDELKVSANGQDDERTDPMQRTESTEEPSPYPS